MKRYFYILLPLLLLALSGCGNMPDYGSLDEPSFRIVEDTVTLVAGESRQLTLSVGISNVIWLSNADSVASVNYQGIVAAHSEGTAVITASRQTAAEPSSCYVIVKPENKAE